MPMPPPLIRDGDVEFTVGRAVLPRLTVPTVQVHRLAVVPGAPVRGFLADALVVGVGAGAAVLVAAPAARVLLRAVALAAVGPFARTGVNPLRAPLPRAIAGASAGTLAGARAGARAAEPRTRSLLVVLLRRGDGPRRGGGSVLGQVLGRRERFRGPLAEPVQYVGQVGVDLDVLPRARVVREPPPLDEHPGLRVRSRVGAAASRVGLRVRSGVGPAAASSSSGPAVAGPTASGAVAPRPSRVGRGDAGAVAGVGRGSRAARRERGALAPAAGTRVGHATAGAAVAANGVAAACAPASAAFAMPGAIETCTASSSPLAAVPSPTAPTRSGCCSTRPWTRGGLPLVIHQNFGSSSPRLWRMTLQRNLADDDINKSSAPRGGGSIGRGALNLQRTARALWTQWGTSNLWGTPSTRRRW